MDYIIIALWGIITGGIFLSSSLHKDTDSKPLAPSQEQALVQVQSVTPESAEPVDVIEQPLVSTTPKKRSGKSKPVAYTKKNPEAAPEVASVPNTKNKALSFKNQKPEEYSQAVLIADVPVVDVPIVDVPLADAPVAVRDTVVVFRVVTEEDGNDLTSAQDDISVAITEPLFDDEPTQPKAYKQSGLKLPGNLIVEQLMCDSDGQPRIHILQRGETLTQIAQLYYADSRFWPYVFDVNRHLLSSPDKIQTDMMLYLPDPVYYEIDGDSPASVERAKVLINKYLK